MASTKKSAMKELGPPRLKKPKISRMIPFVILAGVFITTFVLYQTGYISLENFPYEIKNAACIGVPYDGFDFAPGLIPLLDSNYNGDRSGYTFYLGSGTGFPPMGLILGIDGILRGTPTGRGGNFEVCVKDVGGHSICRTFHLKVNSECITTTITTTTNTGTCPTALNPPCRSEQGGVGTSGGIVPASCNCPSGTTYAGMDNTAPGGPYKICTCN